MELELKVDSKSGIIKSNFDELKEQLNVAIKPYENLVVTEESIKESKDTRAKLNKLKEAIDNKRKQVKKEYSIPLVEYENHCKELISIIDKGSKNIETQLNTYEENRKNERKADVERFFREIAPEYLSIEDIFDDKWLNASCTEKKYKEELSSKVETIKCDVAYLKQEFSDKELPVVLQEYLKVKNVSVAITNYRTLQERFKSVGTNASQEQKNAPQKAYESQKGESLTRAFKVTTSAENIVRLGNFMNENNIHFEKIQLD